ncbi:MAG: hypothetical protein IT208_07620 [Chthonomonadales bacterium]|nr:hypothetical protein [Chthonomonadales bacterium]
MALPAALIAAPFAEGVEDTWSALCFGWTNAPWRQDPEGAATLRGWVRGGAAPGPSIAWDLAVVAWGYLPTARGERYRGHFAAPLEETTAIYRALRAGRTPAAPAEVPQDASERSGAP